MTDFHSIAGKSAGALSLIGFIPYIIAILKKETRPNRVTWFIWSLVGFLLLFSYRSAGAEETLWVSWGNIIAFGFVLVLSINYGEGGWSRFDLACLFGACVGLFFWWYFKSPLPTLYISILIDFCGALPTLKKCHRAPSGEDHLTWVLFSIANITNLFAIKEWNFKIALYPVYLFFISGSICLLLLYHRFWGKLKNQI